jgi:hypothetical protein
MTTCHKVIIASLEACVLLECNSLPDSLNWTEKHLPNFYGKNVCFSPYVIEILTLTMMALGGDTFGS